MKIGIVTQPLHNNYGGLLQNYALQQVLKRMGHEVKTLDFVYKQTFIKYVLSSCRHILAVIIKGRKLSLLPYREFPTVRMELMDDFVRKHIKTTRTIHAYTPEVVKEEYFDAVITGSDQVWRPMYNVYLEDMFLKFVPDHVHKIAYAASFGVDNCEYKPRQTKKCRKLAKRLRMISVRELSGINLCKHHLQVDATKVLDPTILAGVEAYNPLLLDCGEKKFLFAYVLDITPEKKEFVEQMAKENNLEPRIYGADQNAQLSVEEWVSMIAHATMVITDSFHGTVFSILYHKNFYSILNIARGGTRFSSLLCPLGLENRMGDLSQLRISSASPIDWEKVDHILDKQRQDSLIFLTKALKK